MAIFLRRFNILGMLATTCLSAGLLADPMPGNEQQSSQAISYPPGAYRPTLATAEQISAEKAALLLADDPDIAALRAEIVTKLAATPVGQTQDGAATVTDAVAHWTRSLILREAADSFPIPNFIWTTDDTPHTWFGHRFAGTGVAGDNPDAIYRSVLIDGSGQYEITGQIDITHRPAETTFDVTHDYIGSGPLKNQTSDQTDLGFQISFASDRDFTVSPDGSFRLTLGPVGSGPNHLKTEKGTVNVLIREILSDWSQRPASVSIRRIDKLESGLDIKNKPDIAKAKTLILERLRGYVGFWSAYKDTYFGGLDPNELGGPAARAGGWGFIAGTRFQLEPDEALIFKTSSVGAKYTGFQITDPWLIALDTHWYQASMNISQATPNEDGTYTYVVSQTDTGIANWLDTAGLREGWAIARWQNVPSGVNKDELIKDFRVVKLSELGSMQDIPRVTPAERRDQKAARAAGQSNRIR